MTAIDIFSRIELPQKEVFKNFLQVNTFTRCVSPFFTIENFTSSNSNIDTNTSFSLKCAFLDILQFFVTVKEITDKKIVFELNGLIKATQTIYFIEDEKNSTLVREKFEFSLYNQFNIPLLSLILSIFFYIDSFIKHLRFKSLLYKSFESTNSEKKFKDLFSIKSYIVIEAPINEINSLFQDLNKFSLWLSPFIKIDSKSSENDFKCGKEFLLTFTLPILGAFCCRVNKNDSNKIEISFSNPILNGINTWSLLPCENEVIIENKIEIEDASVYLKLVWLLLGNSLLRLELDSWNRRLKDIVERTNLYKDVLVSPSTT